MPLCAVCTAPPISSVQGSASDVAAAILQTATPASLPHLPPSAAPDPRPTKRRKLNGDDDDEDDSEHLSEWLGKPLVKVRRGRAGAPLIAQPDIVFFGEKLDDSFDRSLLADRDEVDLLLVMGTSLKVAPVADVTGHLPHSIPQILINRDPITHVNFDVQLLGDCDGASDSHASSCTNADSDRALAVREAGHGRAPRVAAMDRRRHRRSRRDDRPGCAAVSAPA